jgi:hypothetical protein
MEIKAGETRRIDRVLAENYLADMRSLPLAELRALRNEAEQGRARPSKQGRARGV